MPNLTTELSHALKLQAVPFLSRVKSVLDFVDVAREFSGNNLHTPRAIAFALARAGRNAEAIEVLGQLSGQLDLKAGWEREVADQALALKATLETDTPKAMQQPGAWEADTVRSLGLGEFRVERAG